MQFKIEAGDKDPEMQDLKAKMMLMMEQESSSEEEDEDDFLENLNKEGAQSQETLTRAEREVAEAHN